jgi:lipopolysaccharide transport system ATP-binding protein
MSSSDIAIAARGVSKAYKIAHNQVRATTLAEAVMRKLRHPFRTGDVETFWALNDVSFDIKRGEVVGVIGRNGAGKSTLLKILSRITEPTQGQIDLYGRVGSLLEVGTGFHPELTGRENIYLNGGILGMSRGEIKRQFDAIVDFAEVEKFLDTPVKRYSSGMYVRLAFAVAAHLNPEILVVDEVLAVGDVEFQQKCLGKMKDVADGGRTVLFVSHNMGAVQQLCSRVIRLKSGRLAGDSIDVGSEIRHYLQGGDQGTALLEWSAAVDPKRPARPDFAPLRLALVGEDGQPLTTPVYRGKPAWVEITGAIEQPDSLLTVGYVLSTSNGERLYTSEHTDLPQARWPALHAGVNTIRSRLPVDLLNEGEYRLELTASLFSRYFICQPGVSSPSLVFELTGSISESPYWRARRAGVMAPSLEWEAVTPAHSAGCVGAVSVDR